MRPPSQRLPFPILMFAAMVIAMVTASVVPGSGLFVIGFLLVAVFLYAARNARSSDPSDE